MLEMYWAFFGFGVLFAIVTLIFGDVLESESFPFLQPIVLVVGVTIFGAAGILLTNYSAMNAFATLLLSIIAAILLSVAMYFLYVKRMKGAENSISFSINDLVGRIGEVNTSIPSTGYGEVVIHMGASFTHQIAASFDKDSISEGVRVVVVEVKDDTLYVTKLDEEFE